MSQVPNRSETLKGTTSKTKPKKTELLLLSAFATALTQRICLKGFLINRNQSQMAPNVKNKKPIVVDVSPESDSDWSISDDDFVRSRPQQSRRNAVDVNEKDIPLILDSLVKHGLTVAGKVESDGRISFKFKSTHKPLETCEDTAKAQATPEVKAVTFPDGPVSPDGNYYSRDRTRVKHRSSKHHHKRRHYNSFWF